MIDQLIREYVRLAINANQNLVSEAWWEEQYEDATAKNLELDRPGTVVEPDVRQKVGGYLKKMGLMRGPAPKHPKGPKRKTRLG